MVNMVCDIIIKINVLLYSVLSRSCAIIHSCTEYNHSKNYVFYTCDCFQLIHNIHSKFRMRHVLNLSKTQIISFFTKRKPQ